MGSLFSSCGMRCGVLFLQKCNFTCGVHSQGRSVLLQLRAGVTVFPLPFPRAAAGPHSPHLGPRGSQLAGWCYRSDSAAQGCAEGMFWASPADSGHFTNLYEINKWRSFT